MRAIVLAVLALAVLAAPAAAQTPADTTPTVTTDGLGTIALVPDIADFEVGVLRVAPTSGGARNAANRRIAAILRALRAGGVAAADIQTSGLSLTRERLRRRGRRVIRYRAAQSLTVRARDVSKLGALIDAVSNAGADEVQAPDFGFADPSQGRLLANRAALADARRRADDAAAQIGMRITGVRSVDLDPQTEPVSSGEAGGGGAAPRARPAPTEIRPGRQEFSARVRVVYTAAAA